MMLELYTVQFKYIDFSGLYFRMKISVSYFLVILNRYIVL